MTDSTFVFKEDYKRLPRGRALKPIRYRIDDGGCHTVVSHSKDKDGYTRVCRRVNGKKKMLYLHRVVYEQCVGEIPAGEVVRHSCDNPPCINPDHLLVGTTLDNMRDKVERGRSSYGKRNGRAKLLEKHVLSIRDDYRDALTIANEYGITRSNVYDIRNYKIWKHLKKEDE